MESTIYAKNAIRADLTATFTATTQFLRTQQSSYPKGNLTRLGGCVKHPARRSIASCTSISGESMRGQPHGVTVSCAGCCHYFLFYFNHWRDIIFGGYKFQAFASGALRRENVVSLSRGRTHSPLTTHIENQIPNVTIRERFA